MEKNKDSEPIVSVVMLAYNHERYIAKAIESVLIQKTSFPIELIIGEDFSQDKTREIVQKYATNNQDRIRAIFHEKNLGANKNFEITIKNCRGKYIALLEGDDYWTDPYKLQKEVDFLEVNPEYGMCYTKVRNYIQKKRKLSKIWGGPATTFEELIKINQIPTLTVVVRKKLYLQYLQEIHPEKKNWKMGDYPMWLWISLKTKIGYVNQVTGVYRLLEESANHSKNIDKREIFLNSFQEIKIYFLKYANKSHNEILMNDSLFRCLGSNAVRYKNRNRALTYYRKIYHKFFIDNVKYIICKNRIIFYFFSVIQNKIS